MDYITELKCDDCGKEFSHNEIINTCTKCDGLLEPQYDYDKIADKLDLTEIARRPRTIWKWIELMPVEDESKIVSLGEGGNPLIRCDRLAEKLGINKLFVKNYGTNPTGTHKDLGFSTAVTRAVELGIRRAMTWTSGNAGTALAAYGTRADIDVLILARDDITLEKLSNIMVYGVKVVKVRYESSEEVWGMLEEARKKFGLYQFVNFINPFRHEGCKTCAYEICEQFGWKIPDRMIHPLGTGGGLWGAWKGFNELRKLGLIDEVPMMVGVQPEACAHTVKAFREGREVAERYGDPRKTIVQSLADDTPLAGAKRPLRAMKESKGTAEGVSDNEVLEAIKLLGKEGIFAEAAAATTVAALKKLIQKGEIDKDETVICVNTGTGLKQPEIIQRIYKAPPLIRARLTDLEKVAAWI